MSQGLGEIFLKDPSDKVLLSEINNSSSNLKKIFKQYVITNRYLTKEDL